MNLDCPFCGSRPEASDMRRTEDGKLTERWSCSNAKCAAYTLFATREQWNFRCTHFPVGLPEKDPVQLDIEDLTK
jgi:hypothetical protein